MQILAVTLKNFKTHRDKQIAFAPGTNAICGENGAGKTSILEAIAWALFNYQGDYAKEDLIHNGSGSAEVTVDFISNADGRTYTVRRHTTKGYTLFDPQLNARIPHTRIKDEVLPWLRTHLGVAPGVDLGELFARTIGVPQGTFTADFLQSPENRKAVFDKILKVDEYKTVHKDLNSLRRYAEAQVAAIEQDITTYDERLVAWDDIQQRHHTLATELAATQAQLAALTTQLTTLHGQRQVLKEQADQVHHWQGHYQQIQSQVDVKQQAIARLHQSLEQAQVAVDICADTHPAYLAYQAAETALQDLAQQQVQRQTLLQRQYQLQRTLETRATDLTRLRLQLDGCTAAAADMAQLEPAIHEQTRLETHLAQQQQQDTALALVQGEYQALTQQLAQLAPQIAQAARTIAELEQLTVLVADIPELEQQCDRLQQQLSRVEAARQFEAELQQFVQQGQASCDRYQSQAHQALDILETLRKSAPLLSAEAVTTLVTTVNTGVTVSQELVTHVQQIVADLAAHTDADTLRSHLHRQRHQLTELTQHQRALTALPDRQQQLAHLQQQQATLQARTQELHTQLSHRETLKAAIAETQAALTALQDPRGRQTLLAQSCQQQPTWQKRYNEMHGAQRGIQRQLDEINQALQAFQEVDAAITAQTHRKQTHQPDYLRYLHHQQVAQNAEPLSQELAAAEQALSLLHQERDQVQADLHRVQGQFDPQQLQQLETTYQTVQSQHDRLTGGVPQQQQRLTELQHQLDDLTAITKQRDDAATQRQHRERVKRFINFARRAYKEAGPRITERYVQQVSREGDRLFRDLLNRPNVALTWTRDYEIQVQEGPNSRRFVNLSGGEQMCAALAVRLALLKVLADIDIAFFDEPTTNMDRPRRECLAEAISRIKSFNQLFVISHDDTFEKVTENVIVIERDN